MATLALAAVGAAAGSALLPSGLTVLGATIGGAAIGSQVGALAGSFVDQALFGASGQSRSFAGPRLSDLRVTASTEGAPIPRVYGRARVGGQVIWATDFEEEVVTSKAGGGGKGMVGSSAAKQVEYRYYANFAIGLAEGEISGIGRVWADGQELDLGSVTWRLHTGSEDQPADSLISAREGAGNAPAYRGLAYIVFERMPLASYGNRLPQLSFEVYRAVDVFHRSIRGVVLIPGSGEFVYASEEVTRREAGGTQVAENVHTRQGGTDWTVAVDQLQASLPNAGSVSLVTSWFGTDLRAGRCEIRPGVEIASKKTKPLTWSVAGLTRSQADLVSLHDGRPAYGGTPSDQTVIAAIEDLKARGLAVTLTPFILMDVPAGNALPDPYDGGAPGQAAYPWRGRITLELAPGQPGSPDKTAAAAVEIAQLVGTAASSDFTIFGGTVIYSGPEEWSYRRFILHHAFLAKAAGGVDAFVIGSELRGLTQVQDAPRSYPFVTALVQLAADVKAVLGAETKVTYAADWSEYFGHQPQDGTGDVCFNLDPLWASPAIDAIGIDLYWPLSDWRDGHEHADAVAGVRSIYELDYLKANIAGGEGFDWYYASAADRASQARTPITDGQGKPWVFRYKDLKSWWLNPHFDRPGGIEQATPTGWVPQSKPVWLMETGCPAVDKGANQPNVFIDPKSAETALPYFSNGQRDDFMQRRYLQALLETFEPEHPGALPEANPISEVYGAPMVDPARIHVYAWDARPHPVFPADQETWGDAGNWQRGHWITGRISSAPMADLVGRILDDSGFADHEAGTLTGILPGYTIDRLMAPREALQPLELSFFFDAVESGEKIVFRPRAAGGEVVALVPGALVEERPGSELLRLTRCQETELPGSAKIIYASAANDYRSAVAEARRLAGASSRVAQAELALVLDAEQAAGIADAWLFEAWAARERASFVLPPSKLALEPGDSVVVTDSGRSRLFRVTEVGERGAREIAALSVDPALYALGEGPARTARTGPPAPSGQPLGYLLDLPLLRGDEPEHAGYFAASQAPWPGGVALFRSPTETGFELQAIAGASAVTGVLLDALPVGPIGRLDNAARLRVQLDSGELASTDEAQLLAGANTAAVRNTDGDWEVLQFKSAALVSPGAYELAGLLRGQGGSEGAMRVDVPPGSPFVLITEALARVDLAPDEIGLPFNWRFGPADRDLGHPAYVLQQHAFRGIGLRPLSPVHLRGEKSGSGDLILTWVRRTRLGGDSWETSEAPLAEDGERYEVDILDGEAVKRTLTATLPTVTYSAAQQMQDFGSPPQGVTVRACQIGSVWGRGAACTAVV
ncbi:MAG: glycoside hydrolase TIM-barrel-like domain-containing protein [Hyphomicrobiaceae bacterium]|nr:glycoside hydrolase TIM-barrel-like domain-containing protein [Hyphomicrobiaceae bacterium]